MQKEIMVSVFCAAYNHEPYIRKCLEGFVNQKTDFAFEILVHDDASTDRTADIICEFEENYPDIIKPIYQTENQYSKKVKISRDIQYPRANGKYIAFCEGDDYWTDENKLQKQFDVMENNPECSICTHGVEFMREGIICGSAPICPVGSIITAEQFLDIYAKYDYQFQTSSFFLRKDILGKCYDESPGYAKVVRFGDIPLLLYCINEGNMAYIDEKMSCYRKNVSGGWTDVTLKNAEKSVENYMSVCNMFYEYDKCTEYKYSKKCRQIVNVQAVVNYNRAKGFGVNSKNVFVYSDKYGLKNHIASRVILLKSRIAKIMPFLPKLKQKIRGVVR